MKFVNLAKGEYGICNLLQNGINALHGIKTEKCTCGDAIRLRQFHTRSREITYQSFGLDRKKQVFRLAFFLGLQDKITTKVFIILPTVERKPLFL